MENRKEKIMLYTLCSLMVAGFISSFMLFSNLDKQIKTQLKEINRQQLVIALQQVEIDSYKLNKQDLKLLKDYR